MKILEIKTITSECLDYVTNEKSILIEKNWKVEYKGKKYNRFITKDGVRWDDPNYDRIKAMLLYAQNPSTHSNVSIEQPTISTEELEELFKIMIREKKLEKLI